MNTEEARNLMNGVKVRVTSGPYYHMHDKIWDYSSVNIGDEGMFYGSIDNDGDMTVYFNANDERGEFHTELAPECLTVIKGVSLSDGGISVDDLKDGDIVTVQMTGKIATILNDAVVYFYPRESNASVLVSGNKNFKIVSREPKDEDNHPVGTILRTSDGTVFTKVDAEFWNGTDGTTKTLVNIDRHEIVWVPKNDGDDC